MRISEAARRLGTSARMLRYREDLGRRLGRIPATPGRALDFEKERALRLLSRG